MRGFRTWLQASRLPSQVYICLPLLLGQLMARSAGLGFSLSVLAWVHLFGLCIQLYIVYANDAADAEGDALNRTYTPFSGGSRVVPDRLISREHLRRAAWAMALATLACALPVHLRAPRPLLPGLALAGLLLLQMYSYPPVRLSYRGGGELLQMLGTGTVLPLYGYYAQTGTLAGLPWQVVAMALPAHLACAVATAIPDAPADAAVGKRTAAVLLGVPRARWAVVTLSALAVAGLGCSPALRAAGGAWVWGLALPGALCCLLLRLAPGAVPGSPQMTGFTATAIGCTVSLNGVLCLVYA